MKSMSLRLESLDLDIEESKVYIILLALGPLSLGEIINNIAISHEEAKKSLNGLKNKGYILEIPGVAFRYQALLPFKDLKASAEITISKLETLASQLDEHISSKLGVILGKMKEESQKINEGMNSAQEALTQVEMKGEGDTEAQIAKYVLDLEQKTGQTKHSIIEMFETKQTDHETLVSKIQGNFSQKAQEIGSMLQSTSHQLHDKYQEGISEIKSSENQRDQELMAQIDNLANQSQNSLTEGMQNVHQSMENTGQTLFNSIDERNQKITSHVSNYTTEVINRISEEVDRNRTSIINSLNSSLEQVTGQLENNKKSAMGIFSSTRDDIKSKSIGSAQNLQQTLTEILINTQGQLNNVLQQAQETLSQKIEETKNTLDTTIGKFNESVQLQLDSEIQKTLTNTESTFSDLVSHAQTSSEKTQEEVKESLDGLIVESKKKAQEVNDLAGQELVHVVESLKNEVNSHLELFKTALTPQEQTIKDEITSFQNDFKSAQTQSLEKFSGMMEDLKTSVESRKREIDTLISQETSVLTDSINDFVNELITLIGNYDNQYRQLITESSEKSSEGLIAQTQEIKERTLAVVNQVAKTATNQLNATNELISAGIEAEVTTLETELSDFTSQFKEVTRQNDEMFKNYLFSLEKLATLTSETKRPTIQTAPIISKEATLSYILSMFSRMKGGMTLLIPNLDDVPVDLILTTKTHQRITIVTLIDPETQTDFLKKLFQKPNVRVRRVDTSRFVGAEQYIAADRDGEEVILGIVEDSGQTVAIASQSEAFIGLIGKIVIGGTFLAQSQEITRASVGM